MTDNTQQARAASIPDAAIEAAAPHIAAAAWDEGAKAGFGVTREGFNNECAFEYLADDDYPPTNPYSGQQWLIDGSAEARRG